MSEIPGSPDSAPQAAGRPSLLGAAPVPAGHVPSLSVLAALSDTATAEPVVGRSRQLWWGLGLASLGISALALMLLIKDVTPGHDIDVASAPSPTRGTGIVPAPEQVTPPTSAALPAPPSAASSPLARLEELPAEAPGALAATAAAAVVAATLSPPAAPASSKEQAAKPTTKPETTAKGAATERTPASALEPRPRDGREARQAQEAREARQARQARADRPARDARAAAVAPAAAAATLGAAAATARPGDADVDLIAALVQHMSRDGVLGEGEPTIANLVGRCKALAGPEAQRCLRRICDNYWGRAEACPRAGAGGDVVARP